MEKNEFEVLKKMTLEATARTKTQEAFILSKVVDEYGEFVKEVVTITKYGYDAEYARQLEMAERHFNNALNKKEKG